MLKEYAQIDTEGFIVERFIYDDEDPEVIPDDCKPMWESKMRLFTPKYNRTLSEWEEGDSAEALAAETSRVNAIQDEEPQPTLEERLVTTETQIVTIEETIDVLFGGVI